MILTGGYGQRMGILVGGYAQRVPQTANPSNFNTPFFDPDWAPRYEGDSNGMVEYVLPGFEPDNVYNGRSARVFLPEGVIVSPHALERLEVLLRELKPLVTGISVLENRGPEYIRLVDEFERP